MPYKEIKANIFTLWFNHHTKSKADHYAYYVLPVATAENVDLRASRIEMVENSEKLQLVENQKKQLAGFVFVQPGEANSKIFNKVNTNKPCVLMMCKKGNEFDISISEPTH